MIKQYENFKVNYYPEHELVLWSIKSEGVPNFSIDTLHEFKDLTKDLKMMFADNGYPLKYIVSASTHNEVYNMGGDLPYFLKSIKTQNKEALEEYANLCIDAIYNIYNTFDLPVLSIALVEGNAYGGGFECAMAHDVILSHESAKFCLPENKFHLFPGMGAYSFLCRKLNIKTAIEVLNTGNVYEAKEVEKMGLVDNIFSKDSGITAVVNYLKKSSFSFKYNHYKCIKRVFPLQKNELGDITNMWVDACMNLESESLRRMEIIINAQLRKLKYEFKS
ncbi:crotonase/enoyl-CoA hydratase family protein [uncultured Tenacibaculum sp.]|uniref:crotonase/enoyl-CoA hydratase family protein n=1 Tax=uncultured Tenacibaculum sp. TaxID=174713 RepID=UPI00261E1773|nr:crotonase/enoyl-CoA hydratase family protein [uncultured Tenacibaculum sp.]